MASRHSPGWIFLGFDKWIDCEEAIGFSVDNFIEALDRLDRTGYFGAESSVSDMPVQFIQVNAFETNGKRQLTEIHIESGYSGHATYGKTLSTGCIHVLTVITDGTNTNGYYSNDFCDVNAYWVQGNVFFALRVYSDIKDKDEIQAVLDKIITAM